MMRFWRKKHEKTAPSSKKYDNKNFTLERLMVNGKALYVTLKVTIRILTASANFETLKSFQSLKTRCSVVDCSQKHLKLIILFRRLSLHNSGPIYLVTDPMCSKLR